MSRPIMLCGINFGLAIIGEPPTIIFGAAYIFTFKAFAGSAPFKYAEIGTLPSGITFTDNGDGTATLAGTSTAPGNYPITLQLSDFARDVVAANYTLSVVPLPLSLSGALPDPGIGVAITPYMYAASGGYGGYTFAITAGALPTGLSLNGSTGTVTGTATAFGPFSWTITVTDSHGDPQSLNDSCTVGYATLTISGALTNTSLGSPMGGSLTISGGNGVYYLGATTGTLPSGSVLTLSGSTITDTGATTSGGTDSFTVHVTSGDGQSASLPQTVTISVPDLHWDSARKGSGLILSSSNHICSPNGTNSGSCLAGQALAKTSVTGFYQEFVMTGSPGAGDRTAIGIGDSAITLTAYLGDDTHGVGIYNSSACYTAVSGTPSGIGSWGGSLASGDNVMMAVIYDAGTDIMRVHFGRNGLWCQGIGNSPSSNFATSSFFPMPAGSNPWSIACGNDTTPATAGWEILQSSAFAYSTPAGFASGWPG